MAEGLFSLLHQERQRLEQLIWEADASGRGQLDDVRRLKALHRAVDHHIKSWARDLYGQERHPPLRSA